jgi:hypothetical protein
MGGDPTLALEALDHRVGNEAVAQSLVEARSRIGDDIGVAGGIAEPLLLGIPGMAGVDEQDAPGPVRCHAALRMRAPNR